MDDTRPARAAEQSNPGSNPQFDRGWGEHVAIGPDSPAAPAHGTDWQAGEAGDPNSTAPHRSRAWRAAERAFAGNRTSGYRSSER